MAEQNHPQSQQDEEMQSQQSSQETQPGQVEPHRGVMILVLGILGLVICFILGIIAWVMGNTDLQKMEAGQMDRQGEGLTKAGKICGIISVILAIVGIFIYVLIGGLTAIGGIFG